MSVSRVCRNVLGDRSLGKPWGGSVLDSVIGAYLTQARASPSLLTTPPHTWPRRTVQPVCVGLSSDIG